MEEDLKTKAASLKNHISGFTETYIQIAKVKATKGASNAAAAIAIGVSVFLLAIFFIIFAFTALAWWLADVFESPALGFLTVAGLFLFLIVLIILLSKKVIVPFIRNTIISKVYDKAD